MAYQVTRKSKIYEELELCHANGEVGERLVVDLNLDQMGSRLNKAYENMAIAQLELQKNPRNTEAYGKAVINVFTVLFGEDGANRLLKFYEHNYNELLLDIFPFINNVVMPQVVAASAARKAQLLDATKDVKNSAWRKASRKLK